MSSQMDSMAKSLTIYYCSFMYQQRQTMLRTQLNECTRVGSLKLSLSLWFPVSIVPQTLSLNPSLRWPRTAAATHTILPLLGDDPARPQSEVGEEVALRLISFCSSTSFVESRIRHRSCGRNLKPSRSSTRTCRPSRPSTAKGGSSCRRGLRCSPQEPCRRSHAVQREQWPRGLRWGGWASW